MGRSVDVREARVAPDEAERQLLFVDSKRVHRRRVEVVRPPSDAGDLVSAEPLTNPSSPSTPRPEGVLAPRRRRANSFDCDYVSG
jgi:hypothetical protein